MADKERDLDLMRLCDGELGAEESQRMEAQVRSDKKLAERQAGVREVGELVRTRLEIATDHAAETGRFEQLWTQIQKNVGSERERKRTAPFAETGLWAALRRFWNDHQGHVLSGAAAAAVVLLLVVAVRPFERVEERTVQTPPVIQPAIARAQAPEIENLEIYEGTGMIFTVTGEDGDAPTAVIWLSGNPEAPEGPL